MELHRLGKRTGLAAQLLRAYISFYRADRNKNSTLCRVPIFVEWPNCRVAGLKDNARGHGSVKGCLCTHFQNDTDNSSPLDASACDSIPPHPCRRIFQPALTRRFPGACADPQARRPTDFENAEARTLRGYRKKKEVNKNINPNIATELKREIRETASETFRLG